MKNIEHELRETVEGTVTMAVRNHKECFERVKILRRFSREENIFFDKALNKFDATLFVAVRFVRASLSLSTVTPTIPMTMADLMGDGSRDPFGLKQLWRAKRFQRPETNVAAPPLSIG